MDQSITGPGGQVNGILKERNSTVTKSSKANPIISPKNAVGNRK